MCFELARCPNQHGASMARIIARFPTRMARSPSRMAMNLNQNELSGKNNTKCKIGRMALECDLKNERTTMKPAWRHNGRHKCEDAVWAAWTKRPQTSMAPGWRSKSVIINSARTKSAMLNKSMAIFQKHGAPIPPCRHSPTWTSLENQVCLFVLKIHFV